MRDFVIFQRGRHWFRMWAGVVAEAGRERVSNKQQCVWPNGQDHTAL
jgi:hypothetical protein